MRVAPPTTAEDLESLAAEWNSLTAGVPFRRWEWCAAWWRHYDDEGDWFTPTVRDANGTLVGIAPWFLAHSATRGRVIRFLGGGEVASDYLTILCRAGTEDDVAGALADWLTGDARRDWDLLELTGVDAADAPVASLCQQLAARGAAVHRREGPNCWRLEFPPTWDEYQARLSKSHRKHMRRLESRYLDSGRAAVRSTTDEDAFDMALTTLIDLHQRRWESQGEPGCFASPRFAAFHRDVARRLLRVGLLRLSLLDLDGRTVAADYSFAGEDGLLYAYQSGVDPAALEDEPGTLMNVAVLTRALQAGFRGVDFLRGDEPYKPHLRAAPRPSMELRIAAPRSSARMRQTAWEAGQNVKSWARRGLRWAEGLRGKP